MTDCAAEFPDKWFEKARLCSDCHDPDLNYFGVNASQSLSVWRTKDGYTLKIHVDGSNGTADIIWDEGFLMMSVKLNDGI